MGLHTTYFNNIVLTFVLDFIGVVKMACTVKKDDILVLQYPRKKYFRLICLMARMRKAHTITLIHDLGSMRRKRLTEKKEIKKLMHTDYVIASNEKMKQWLLDRGYTHPVGALQLFDYRSRTKNEKKEQTEYPDGYKVAYAGLLSARKNSFLVKMQPIVQKYQLEIFGNSEGLPGLKKSDKIHVHNFMVADDFIAVGPGDFGLVWDGDSIETCSGDYGDYLRWNSPHKVSFYLRASMPVIVWKQSAVASIVEQEQIGISIDSLEELNERLATISVEEMNRMRCNVERVGYRLSIGDYFCSSINKAIEELHLH